MNSNIITEKLIGLYNYDFSDDKAFEKVVNRQLNLVNYFSALLRDFKMLDCALDIISIKDHIENEKKIELAIKNADDTIKDELENFSFIVYPALKNAFLEKLDYILLEMEEFVPSYLKEVVIDIINKDKNFDKSLLNGLQNDLPLFSFSVNVSKNSFADIFMQKVIEKLIQTNDLDCIDELYSQTRDNQCIAILLEVMQETQKEFASESVIDGVIAFDEVIYNRAFEIFYEDIKGDLDNNNGIFKEISKFLTIQISGLYEFSKSYYEKYGNVIVMPIADMLRNSFIKADNDLKAYMESINKDMDVFLIDIPKRLCDNYYLNYNYSAAKEIDKKVKELL